MMSWVPEFRSMRQVMNLENRVDDGGGKSGAKFSCGGSVPDALLPSKRMFRTQPIPVQARLFGATLHRAAV
jgi:hypothetical protein